MTLRRMTSFLLALIAPFAVMAAPAHADVARPAVAAGAARVNDLFAHDLATLPADAPYRAYVHFRGGTPDSRAALLVDHGLIAGHDFATVAATSAFGAIGQIAGLRHEPLVSYVEAVRPVLAHGDTAVWSTNVGNVQQAIGKGPYVDPADRVLDGTGIGIAVIDSGVDGTHPDLAARMAKNYHVTCATTPFLVDTTTNMCPVPVFTELGTTDTIGHGSHVAGIAAGDGTASRGTYRGVAPGAKIFAYAINNGLRYDYIAEALDHMVTNYDTFTPRIRVLNNSWGDPAGTPHDPDSVESGLVRQLVAKGVTVVFSAGNGDALNNGGTGADDRLSSTAKDPTPGVITVANYDDADLGIKNGAIDFTSSRGHLGHPDEYPDLAAPGMSITSTCSPHLPDCQLGASINWAPDYALLSGTSMSAPHVAGIAALLYQARPDLTPAQVEDLLQDTALRFGAASTYEPDPQNPGGTISFDKGAGLVDVRAAVEALGVAHRGSGETVGTPALGIATPVADEQSDGTTPLLVSGTADDGHVAPAPFVEKILVSGEGGDAPGPGGTDVTALSVVEQAGGLRYTVAVRNVTDVAPGSSYLLSQVVNGTVRETRLNMSGTAVTASTSAQNAPPADIVRDVAGNRFSFTLSWASLGNPPAGTAVFHLVLRSYIAVLHDLVPGGGLADNSVKLSYAPAFDVRRPAVTPPPVTAVTVSVDGGPATPATLTGSGPAYDWSALLDTSGLAAGVHTVTAQLVLDGAERVVRTQSFVVERGAVHAIAVTSPAEGAAVPRDVVTISGTASSTAPAGAVRRVAVRVTGAGYDSTALTADGAEGWTLPFDVRPLDTGSYLVTAQLYVAGELVATSASTFLVPVFATCRPEGLSFWRDQYTGGPKARYTLAERDLLADRAVVLSTGYFRDRQQLVTTLFADGKLPAELTAARQFAALVLNLAAGDLSTTMSYTAGLSGREALSARTYDTSRVGATADAATAFVRAQLPGGDLIAANDVATALNKGTGLLC